MHEKSKVGVRELGLLLALVLAIFVFLPHQRAIAYMMLPSLLLIGAVRFTKAISFLRLPASLSEREARGKQLTNLSNALFVVGVIFTLVGVIVAYVGNRSVTLMVCAVGACSSVSIGAMVRTYLNLEKERWR